MNLSKNNPILKDQEMKRYFDTLPEFVQVTIEQSGLMPADLQELKSAAENLMKKN